MKKTLKLLSLSTILALGLGNSVFAATSGTTPGQVTLQSGTMDITAPATTVNLGSITVDSTVKTVNANLTNMTVVDNRGTGEGWNITVSASQFTQTTGGTPLKLPTNTLKLNGIGTITQTVGTSGGPTTTTAPWTIDTGAVKVLSAATNKGMGTFTVAFPVNAVSLNVDTAQKVVDPANNPTVYASTLSWVVSTGP